MFSTTQTPEDAPEARRWTARWLQRLTGRDDGPRRAAAHAPDGSGDDRHARPTHRVPVARPATADVDTRAASQWTQAATLLQSRFGAATSRFGLGSGFGATARGGSTEMSSLSPSLLQDLLRFERLHGEQRQLLEVLAAAVRHMQPLAIRLDTGSEWVTLTIFPIERLVHCRLPLHRVLRDADASEPRVLQVQPATHRPPQALTGPGVDRTVAGYAPLAPVLWAVALTGTRAALLPELAGQAAYRMTAGLHLDALPLPDDLVAVLARLRRVTVNLRELAAWSLPGGAVLGREGAARLLNALYLQSALIVSRTHPAAAGEGWRGGSR